MSTNSKRVNRLLWTKALFLVVALCSAGAAPPPGQNWVLVAHDEFANDTTIDTDMWGYGSTPWGSESQGTCCLIRPQDTYLTTNGIVNVTESGPFTGTKGTYTYADGWIWLRPSQWRTYGYLEIRAQYPNEPGAWPAFWMLQSGWPPEIDVAEYRGAPKSYMTEAFYNDNSVWSTTTVPDTGGSFTGWHTYGLYWEPGVLKWYIDGVLKKTVNDRLVPSTPMYVILSGGADCSDANGTGFPNEFVINYFRWYQVLPTNAPAAPTGLTVTTVSNSQLNLSWTASIGADSYDIKRATVSGGPYQTIATTLGLTATTYTDTNLVNFTTYYYVVSAVNSYGESTNSSEVSATPVPPPPSQGQPVTASTYQTGNDPAHGNDGDFSTRWAASDGTFPQWWRVDLGSVQPITKAIIYWYNSSSRAYQYQIATSDDDTNYTTLVDNTGNSTYGITTNTFLASARYVRITVTGVIPAGGWAGFYECQIFGAAVAPPPPPTLAFKLFPNLLQLSWAANGGGWQLQSQTNSLGQGLGTNWVNVPDSTTVTQMDLPIDPANPAVFYRLISQ